MGSLAKLAGQREVTVEVEESVTCLDLLDHLADRFGPRFSSSLFRAPGELHTYVRVFLNEEEMRSLDRPLPLHDGRPQVAVFVLPAMTGGCDG